MGRNFKQYYELKAKHPDALLLFRSADFYECYREDAKNASDVLGLNLTCDINDGVICAFPFHALDTYLPKLIRAGYRIAICDQLEAPKTLAKRGVTELVTPASKPTRKIELPKLTKKQYDLLCECIRYRCADNQFERQEAVKLNLPVSCYDRLDGLLNELKQLIYNLNFEERKDNV